MILKTRAQIDKMRTSGRVLARTLKAVSKEVRPGVTPVHLNQLAHRMIEEAGGYPSFLHYRNYPAATCISVNEVVVHGIPSESPLHEGDIISLDFGVLIDGYHADSAWTFAVGEVAPETRKLMEVTEAALWAGIEQAQVGHRVGDIGAAVQWHVESNGFAIVRDLVGHGIGQNLHEEPNVPNYGKAGKGPVLRAGTTMCIEPMVNAGTWRVNQLDDGWTIVTADGSLSAHYEHTIAITDDGPEIITVE